MQVQRPDRLLVVLTSLIGGLYVMLSTRTMPRQVAVHFGDAGLADGWMSRTLYVGIMVLFVAGLPATLWYLQRRRARLGRARVPMPNLWFDGQRRDASLRFLQLHAAVFAVALSVLLCRVHALVKRANETLPEPRIDLVDLALAVGLFVLFVVGWLAARRLHFRIGE